MQPSKWQGAMTGVLSAMLFLSLVAVALIALSPNGTRSNTEAGGSVQSTERTN